MVALVIIPNVPSEPINKSVKLYPADDFLGPIILKKFSDFWYVGVFFGIFVTRWRVASHFCGIFYNSWCSVILEVLLHIALLIFFFLLDFSLT